MFKYGVAVGLMLLSFALTQNVTAESVVISSGFLRADAALDFGPIFQLIGDDFAFSGGPSGTFFATLQNVPPGGLANLNAAVNLHPFNPPLTFEGKSFRGVGNLTFTATLTPLVVLADNRFATASSVFTMTGQINLHDPNVGFPSPVLQTLTVNGQGFATGSLQLLEASGTYQIHGLNFTFAPPAVIPEPSTILLSATALLGLAIRRWRRS